MPINIRARRILFCAITALSCMCVLVCGLARAERSGNDAGFEVCEGGITIERVQGDVYRGYMMIVDDPSRVFMGVYDKSFRAAGKRLDLFAQKYDAIAVINSNGFSDEGGTGNGGTPLGLVISEGVLLKGASGLSNSGTVAGFDANHVLHVGVFSTARARELGLRDAGAWGPALIIDGVVQEFSGTAGLNPRTAIGQRADGAVLFLVIEGRHVNSLGANYHDLAQIMSAYGAVNAMNLDGGPSSAMYYNGRHISELKPLASTRGVPVAFIVRREGD